jgi:DNA-binding SARP family transcriptional activator
MAPTLTLQLIGPLRMLTAAGKPLSLPNRKTRALLAYLAQIARPHARLALSALFCQNSDDPSRALRWHLTMIRRHLGPEALLASTDTVELNQEVVEVDTRSFANVLSGDLTRPSIAQLASTLELYRGEPFTGLALPDVPEFELWLLGQRAHLQQLYERGLAHLVERLIAVHEFDPALYWARQLVGVNPLFEEGHATLIWLYAHLGQRQAALDQYIHYRTLLQQEFAADPTPALAVLVETIRNAIETAG